MSKKIVCKIKIFHNFQGFFFIFGVKTLLPGKNNFNKLDLYPEKAMISLKGMAEF